MFHTVSKITSRDPLAFEKLADVETPEWLPESALLLSTARVLARHGSPVGRVTQLSSGPYIVLHVESDYSYWEMFCLEKNCRLARIFDWQLEEGI
jgi:hypothetical protein